MLENISRGTKLGKGLTVLKKISYGENWCLYQTFANDTILCVKSELANKWIKVGLVSLDIFNEYAKNTKILFSVSMQGKRLESLTCADSPDSIEDAISFTVSLKKAEWLWASL